MSGHGWIPVVVLKNCEPEILYILADLFNKCLKETFFPDWQKVSSVVPVLENVGEKTTAKNYCPVSLRSLVSEVLEKPANKRIVDHLDKCGLFSDVQYGLSLFNQLQIFWQLYLIELLGRLTGLGLFSCRSWYSQGFWQGLTYLSSSQT